MRATPINPPLYIDSLERWSEIDVKMIVGRQTELSLETVGSLPREHLGSVDEFVEFTLIRVRKYGFRVNDILKL
jgi:hypothetical protein